MIWTGLCWVALPSRLGSLHTWLGSLQVRIALAEGSGRPWLCSSYFSSSDGLAFAYSQFKDFFYCVCAVCLAMSSRLEKSLWLRLDSELEFGVQVWGTAYCIYPWLADVNWDWSPTPWQAFAVNYAALQTVRIGPKTHDPIGFKQDIFI